MDGPSLPAFPLILPRLQAARCVVGPDGVAGAGLSWPMATSNRASWALLILRIAVGFLFLASALLQLRSAGGPITMAHSLKWGLLLIQAICGTLVMIGVWVSVACVPLFCLHGWPVLQGLLRGANPTVLRHELLTMASILACGIGGAGKWGMGRS